MMEMNLQTSLRKGNVMRSVLILGVLVCAGLASPARGALVAGLSVREVTQPEFALSTGLSIAATPAGELVLSNGLSILRVVAEGQPMVATPLRQADGGPLANNSLTTSLTFDALGRTYINDFVRGRIFRSNGAAWDEFATVIHPDDMVMHGDDLIVLHRRNGDEASRFVRIAPNGNQTVIADVDRAESFGIDRNGNLWFAEYVNGEIHRIAPDGTDTSFGRGTRAVGVAGGAVLIEAFAITPEGKLLLGVNRGAVPGIAGNSNQLDRYDPITDEIVTLGINFTGQSGIGFKVPADFDFNPTTGELVIAAFGSIQPQAVVGNLDLVTSGLQPGAGIDAPEPATALMFGLAGMVLLRRTARARGN